MSFITAEAAKNVSNEYRDIAVANEADELKEMIDAATEKGEFCIILDSIMQENEDALLDVGYKVLHLEYCIEVNWEQGGTEREHDDPEDCDNCAI